MATFTVLEPMSTGDVIDRAVRLYRRNFTAVLAIAGLPSLLGYLTGLALGTGYREFLTSLADQNSSAMQPEAIILLLVGMVGYPVWFFIQVFTLTGMARVVGDQLMMGETITLRRCFSVARARFGDILLMTLLIFVILLVLGFAFLIAFFAVVLVVGLIAGIAAATGLPAWLSGVLLAVFGLLSVCGGAILVLLIMSRVAFLPQALMIEGLSAGSSLGRAMTLGSGNWYRIGAILLFTYFVRVSLLAAMTLPALLALAWFRVPAFEFAVTPMGTAIYSAFDQIANVLSLPIWVVSFTLLYFDNRVRKEGYDMELLARDVAPGFHWQPTHSDTAYAHSAFSSTSTHPPRVYMQTGPLGLGGYMPPPHQAPPSPAYPSERPYEGAGGHAVRADDDASSPQTCQECGAELPPQSRFCIRCGSQRLSLETK